MSLLVVHGGAAPVPSEASLYAQLSTFVAEAADPSTVTVGDALAFLAGTYPSAALEERASLIRSVFGRVTSLVLEEDSG